MTLDIALVLAILAVSFLLFVTEWLRMDVVALLVLGALAVTGLVPPEQTLSGFSNPAVITVWAMFMLSAGLTQTGVANIIGQHTLRLAGRGETRMVVVVMIAAGVLSAFMNNIGVAALMLPVVMDIARRSNIPPSRLLMPLAFSTLLGGLTTLIGTPPNLIASQALDDAGLPPFSLFDFTPVGGVVMLAGVAFITLWARRWLPVRDPATETAAESEPDPEGQYGLRESAVLRLCSGSPLEGMTLGESRLGAATGLNVYAVVRDGKPHPAPDRFFVLQSGDHLVVEGQLDRFEELLAWQEVIAEESEQTLEELFPDTFSLTEFIVPEKSNLVGRSLGEVAFRAKHRVLVLAIRRGAELRRMLLADYPLQPGDRLLVEAPRERIEALRSSGLLEAEAEHTREELVHRYGLQHRLLTVRLKDDSVLVGQSVTESRLADALGMMVIAILRDEKHLVWPGRQERLLPGDRLVTRGRPEDVDVFLGLQCLEVQQETAQATASLRSERSALVEATLSPRSLLAGKNLRQTDFRARYGLQVLAILRGDKVIRSNLRDRKLKFGDVLLLHGEREYAARLALEPNFLVLSKSWQKTINTARAPVAALIMAAVLVPVLFGWLPIAVTAVIGATLMVITGCLTMEEAYRAVEWRAIFLIAGMLPLGTAMQTSGTANMLAEGVLSLAAPLGPWGVIIGLYLVTAAATMIIPTAALVVLMAPIALKASAALGISPHAVIMAIAIAASASFTSPISHPANLLVMGPGGYRFSDYVKTGVPLTILIAIVALLLLPWVWPLYPAP